MARQDCPYPECGRRRAWYWGWYYREEGKEGTTIPYGHDETACQAIPIRRFYCPQCGRTFSWRPRFLVFGRRHAAAAYQLALQDWVAHRPTGPNPRWWFLSPRSAAGNPPIFASLTLLATFEVALRPIRRGFSPLMARGLGGMALLAVQMDARRHSSARPPSREPPRVGRRPTRRSASSSVRWPVTRLREIRVRAPSSGGLRGIVRLKALLAGKR